MDLQRNKTSLHIVTSVGYSIEYPFGFAPFFFNDEITVLSVSLLAVLSHAPRIHDPYRRVNKLMPRVHFALALQ